MRTLGSLGIALSIAFGFLLLALVAEIYYFLWWKKRTIISTAAATVTDNNSSSCKSFLSLFCFSTNSPSSSLSSSTPREITDECQSSPVKPLVGEEGIEAELIRLHNLSGFPRLLFTINEETKEDMESEDVKSKGGRSRKGSRGKSLSDLLFAGDTPFMTPISSPRTSMNNYNPLFECRPTPTNWARSSPSPPPKFKFLRDAEEKLYRKTLMEEALKLHRNSDGGSTQEDLVKLASVSTPSLMDSKEEEGSFIKIIIGQQHPSSTQVIPLPSSTSVIPPTVASSKD